MEFVAVDDGLTMREALELMQDLAPEAKLETLKALAEKKREAGDSEHDPNVNLALLGIRC